MVCLIKKRLVELVFGKKNSSQKNSSTKVSSFYSSFLLFVIVAVIISIILSPSVFGLSLSGTKLSPIIFEPGKRIVNHYTITDTSHPTEVTVGGDLAEYLKLEKINDQEFDLIINFPEKLIPQGSYEFNLVVAETSASDEGIGSLITVAKRFQVEVYSHHKEIMASLSVPSINENSPLHLQVEVQSRCYVNIDSVYANILIYNAQGQEVGKTTTTKKALPTLTKANLIANLDTKGWPASDYEAKAVINYDGLQKELNSTFKIGNMDLLLRNYTKELRQDFSKFSVVVFNNWGNELRNVYAKLYIDNKEWLQTPSLTINPWQEGVLEGLVKVEKEPGQYQGMLRLFFEGESKDIPININVVEYISPEKMQAEVEITRKNLLIQTLSVSIILLIILLIVLWLFLVKWKNKSRVERDLLNSNKTEKLRKGNEDDF